MERVPGLLAVPPSLRALAGRVAAAGGRLWVVGGAVRDALAGRSPGDLDVEVHGLAADELEPLLREIGRVRVVGRSFGVFLLRLPEGAEVEVSLPRRRSAGAGAAPEVRGEPHLGLEAAARRRDLTVNAMAWDPLDGRLADPCGGRADLAARRFRAADPATFGDDPLRAWRVASLAARLGFEPDDELVGLCRALDTSGLPAERVRGEVEKLLLAASPSAGLRVARRAGLLARDLPELAALPPGVPDAALDRVAAVRDRAGRPPRPLAVAWGALLHALGAAEAEAVLDRLDVHGRLRYPLRRRVLAAVAGWRALARPGGVSFPVLARAAEEGEVAVTALVAWAATGERGALDALAAAERAGIAHAPLPPLLTGRHLRRLGVPPGPAVGRLLAAVREAQLDGRVADRASALALARRLLERHAEE